ncbi:WD repeat containing cyclophilin family peptidyl- prolyl cis-trans isomerase Cyp9 [Schizosaccharomyces cryophilus OY26]|uniref:peptidylprolyl isomerase n=1 Tax=Schizosaccharomyces cryophilus (strain OY26 / ATCC MYA-4695 / CBS 11777 / NBRC 106824 / NRRL Y48691) TaxID=653667 RepID=S9X886_SCHCR|nr:WD repeat containing cyclophilin family peptidyl- prolyl cis-trans isomerase Cyp9 [Schizosaccharomyces cryophilus OY26]EPY50011.1 WD repeat containing cyclophilin family peptidyl- prolyl cis-trans isomerase Cyp9 [Schizosaccharomyces cryophilus OY26]
MKDDRVSENAIQRDAPPLKKIKKQNQFSSLLENIPNAARYRRSFMHKDTLHSCYSTKSNLILTISYDGHVKFWHKTTDGIEYIKDFPTHNGKIISTYLSKDERILATCADDNTVKVFDIDSIDMVNIIDLDFVPNDLVAFSTPSMKEEMLAVSDANTPLVYFFDLEGDGNVLYSVKKHSFPVHVLEYINSLNCMLSVDKGGMVEYWCPEEPFQKPNGQGIFELKSQTDLYIFKKTKSIPSSIQISPSEKIFSSISYPDWKVRVFDVKSGRILLEFDEHPLNAAKEMEQALEKEDVNSLYFMNQVEFGRRLAIERDIERSGWMADTIAIFDESENYIIYGSILGVKIQSISDGSLVRVLGRDESIRFVKVSLYQGAPKKGKMASLEIMASNNPLVEESFRKDPTLFCTAWKKQRFYLFGSADENITLTDRDTLNEHTVGLTKESNKPEERTALLGKAAVLHTTQGDISIKLLPEEAPKAVQNFTTHAVNGYYDNTIFHRIIKNFMIQGGDPLGDGTGGESIWGKDFEDEFSPNLKHDRPFTVSMANSGPNTNGSQFFITTDLTPWLDGKHTIFGRAYAGLDVVHRIEQSETDKYDRPLESTKIINISILYN